METEHTSRNEHRWMNNLSLQFSLQVFPCLLQPHACNSQNACKKSMTVVDNVVFTVVRLSFYMLLNKLKSQHKQSQIGVPGCESIETKEIRDKKVDGVKMKSGRKIERQKICR